MENLTNGAKGLPNYSLLQDDTGSDRLDTKTDQPGIKSIQPSQPGIKTIQPGQSDIKTIQSSIKPGRTSTNVSSQRNIKSNKTNTKDSDDECCFVSFLCCFIPQ
jgi:hypothetical protein